MTMRYAVNLADLMGNSMGRFMARLIVRPVAGESVQVSAERFDEEALILDCDEERAEAIIRTLRMSLSKNDLRCYQSENGKGWRRA